MNPFELNTDAVLSSLVICGIPLVFLLLAIFVATRLQKPPERHVVAMLAGLITGLNIALAAIAIVASTSFNTRLSTGQQISYYFLLFTPIACIPSALWYKKSPQLPARLNLVACCWITVGWLLYTTMS